MLYVACSLGEQQRVAFLRLLLHRPPLAFLDEVLYGNVKRSLCSGIALTLYFCKQATGAVDTVTEAALYKALQQQSQSYISVGEAHKSVQADRLALCCSLLMMYGAQCRPPQGAVCIPFPCSTAHGEVHMALVNHGRLPKPEELDHCRSIWEVLLACVGIVPVSPFSFPRSIWLYTVDW